MCTSIRLRQLLKLVGQGCCYMFFGSVTDDDKE